MFIERRTCAALSLRDEHCFLWANYYLHNRTCITGTIGLLLCAKNAGYIINIKPILDKMIEQKFRISDRLYNEVLELVNENK